MTYGLDRYIYINEYSLSKDLCEEIIHKFEEQEENKGPGYTFGGIQPKIKDTIDYNIEVDNKKWERIRQTLIVELINNIELYACKLDTQIYHSQVLDINQPNQSDGIKYYTFKELSVDGLFFETIMVQKYKSNKGRYVFHNDASFESTQQRNRVLTYIYYLNDVEEGGETQFWDNYKVKPKKGQLVLFPASWIFPHSGLMPISSDKYIITGWIYEKSTTR
jgi:hypothetical protein